MKKLIEKIIKNGGATLTSTLERVTDLKIIEKAKEKLEI